MSTLYRNAETKFSKTKGHSFAYREVGPKGRAPIVMLHHLTAVLDDWDPRVIEGLAANHHVIVFDNTGVGRSEGKTPSTVEEMAQDAEVFIDSLGLNKVDLLGYSLGGFIAPLLAIKRPELVRRLVLAGTGPPGGEGISNIGTVLQNAMQKAVAEKKHSKLFLFFTRSENSQKAANEFLARLAERVEDKDFPISKETVQAQVAAIAKFGNAPANPALRTVKQPALVVNGDNDIMIPTINSVALFQQLPNAELSIFPDAGHGAIFQYHKPFVEQTLRFLGANQA